MNILSSFLVAFGLSMDNMAVTLSAGCAQRTGPVSRILWQISTLFALAHFLMFALGYEGGTLVHAGHKAGAWTAFIILLVIGGRMIKNAFSSQPEVQPLFTLLRTQIYLAVATSLDALFVGAGMGLSAASFWPTILLVTGCVFITSFCGFYMGQLLGRKFGPKMEMIGGGVLILLGAKVLLEGLGIL